MNLKGVLGIAWSIMTLMIIPWLLITGTATPILEWDLPKWIIYPYIGLSVFMAYLLFWQRE